MAEPPALGPRSGKKWGFEVPKRDFQEKMKASTFNWETQKKAEKVDFRDFCICNFFKTLSWPGDTFISLGNRFKNVVKK